jgi:hypothetical protein
MPGSGAPGDGDGPDGRLLVSAIMVFIIPTPPESSPGGPPGGADDSSAPQPRQNL